MWMTYSVLSCKLARRFSTFSSFVLSGKNGKSLLSSCIFSGYWTSTSRKYLSSLSSLSSIYLIYLLEAFAPYKWFISQYWRYDDPLFLS